MPYRAFAILAVICLALGAGGCRSNTNSNYEEVLMPLQTGSLLQRRILVRTDRQKKTKKKKEKAKAPKPEAEASATPSPEEESTPPPDRFR